MSDKITVTNNQGCGVVGSIIGVILALVAIPLLFWNEGRAVTTYKTLLEGAGIVQTISATEVDPAYDGKLVHLSGRATTNETLSDTILGVSAKAISLQRKAEMYQWEESSSTKDNKTTYSYDKEWAESLINSQSFHAPEGHQNPAQMPYQSQTWFAETVTVGSFNLSASLIRMINNYQPLVVEQIPTTLGNKAKLSSGGFYIGNAPESPQVGDLRINFSQVVPTSVSLIAKVKGKTFEPYLSQAGGTIELLKTGEYSAQEMFDEAQTENTLLTWALRLVGFLMMFFGIAMFFSPLSSLFEMIPFVGNIIDRGIGCITWTFSFAISFAMSLIIIAIGWIFYRPFLAIALIAIGLMPIVGVAIWLWASRKKDTA